MAALSAAIAAGFSAVAAFRQETATYESVLYNRQVDAVATFSSEVNAALDESDVLLKRIVYTVRREAQDVSRTDLRNHVVQQISQVKRFTGVFMLVFPLDEFAPLENNLKRGISNNLELIDSLDDNPNVPHLKFDNPADAVNHYTDLYHRRGFCVPPELRILVDCAKRQLRSGHAVGTQFAHDCAKSLSPTPEQVMGSDAAICIR